MLQLSGALHDIPVMSLRTGSSVATARLPIINPKNLRVEGFYCDDSFNKSELILLYQDIRDVLPEGLVIDDHEKLVEPADLVRLRGVLERRFELLGKPIETVSKDKVGKVGDYAIETTTMYVQKIYAHQSLLRSLTNGSLSIDRSQIVDVTDERIVINDLLKTAPAGAPVIA
jgi:uncharacterized protein YrrD